MELDIRLSRVLTAGLLVSLAVPAAAQDSSRINEVYHIFDFKTQARRGEVIKALQDGLNPNVSKSDSSTPIVMGEPPEKPGRFTLVNPFENSNFPLAGLIPAAQMAMVKQVRCDGAVWISSATRKVRGSQDLRLTLCLFPYREGYELSVYGVDVKERGGGISARLGRALGQAIVGNSDNWTNKTILDAVRSVRTRVGAEVRYVEGQPEFTGSPWLEATQVVPSKADKGTVDTTTGPKPTE